MAEWKPTDNSALEAKAELRRRYLPKSIYVLDLFCGNGQMYEKVYRDHVAQYHGVDKEKIHTPGLCTLTKNTIYVSRNDIEPFNVFDLDDYGSPWGLFYLILKKKKAGPITIFMTDGLVQHQKVDGKVTKFVSATEGLPQKWNIPGINRWYVDIFATMLKDIDNRFGWETKRRSIFTTNGAAFTTGRSN